MRMRCRGLCRSRPRGRCRLNDASDVELAVGGDSLRNVLDMFGCQRPLGCGTRFLDLSKLGEAGGLGGLLRGKGRSQSFLLRGGLRRSLRRSRRLFFGGSLHVGSATTPTNGCIRRGRWRSRRWGFDGRRSATPRRRGRCVLSFGAQALFSFPAGAHTRDLLVGEQTQMTAHGDIHLPKQADDLIGGDPELASHVMNAKFAQTSSSGARGEPDSNNSRIPRASCASRIPTAAV